MLGVWEFHKGIDIAAEVGTGAKAVADGRVTELRKSETLGNVLTYKTINGYEIIYAHLKGYNCEEGDLVKQGEVVAYTGNTGLSTGPHLHYGIKLKDEYIDPYDFVDLNFTDEVKDEYDARGEAIE